MEDALKIFTTAFPRT